MSPGDVVKWEHQRFPPRYYRFVAIEDPPGMDTMEAQLAAVPVYARVEILLDFKAIPGGAPSYERFPWETDADYHERIYAPFADLRLVHHAGAYTYVPADVLVPVSPEELEAAVAADSMQRLGGSDEDVLRCRNSWRK